MVQVTSTLVVCATLIAAFFISPFITEAAKTYSIDLEKDSSQYLSISDTSSLSIVGDLTEESWFNFESLPTSGETRALITKNEAGSNRSTALTIQAGGEIVSLSFAIDETGNNSDTSSVTYNWNPSTGTWYHVAAVFSATTGTVELFINGVSVASSTGTANSIYDGNASTYIGMQGSTLRHLDGKIDDVRIWNVARTNAEIATSMSQKLTGSEFGLVAFWQLNDGLSDSTTNGNNLVNNNGAVFSTDSPYHGRNRVHKRQEVPQRR